VNHVAERKEAYRKALQLGGENAIETLKSIYTVVYGCDWDLIETHQSTVGRNLVAGVGCSIASAAEVKEAHRRLQKNGILTHRP